jgi:hypothetical protein
MSQVVRVLVSGLMLRDADFNRMSVKAVYTSHHLNYENEIG